MTDLLVSLAGQSNIVGRASYSAAPDYLKNHTFTRTKIWWNGTFENYDPSTVQTHDQFAGDHGVDAYLAYQFEKDPAHANDTLYFIKYGEGGRPLFNTSPSRTWSPDAAANIYDEFVTYANAGIAALPVGYEVLGFYWLQGETDSQVLEHAEAYFDNVFSLFNSNMNPDIPFILTGKLVFGNIANQSFWTYRELVWAAENKYVATGQNTVLIDTTGLAEEGGDPGHYSAHSFSIMGKDLYGALTGTDSVNASRNQGVQVLVVDPTSNAPDYRSLEQLVTREAKRGDIVVDTRLGKARLLIKNESGLVRSVKLQEGETEETVGVWAPEIGGSTSDVQGTYTVQNGNWIKNGGVVTAFFNIEVLLLGTITGTSMLSKLPFTVKANISGRGGAVNIGIFETLATPAIFLGGTPRNGTDQAYFRFTDSAAITQTYCPNTFFGNGSVIRGYITYLTDE